MIKADIIADSINPYGNRIVSWILTYPRFIHAEFLTHRLLSKNASSSRAIPIEKAIALVKENPSAPEFWGANQKGMQAAKELDNPEIAKAEWLNCRDEAIQMAERLLKLGLHKQIANRVIEPFSHITVMATATEYDNFFALRAHPDAQPEFQVLAYRMLNKYLKNTPVNKALGDWHIPFGDKMPDGLTLQQQLMVATARSARLSYLTFDGLCNIENDFILHNRLMDSGHWSPFEHCAQATDPFYLTDTGNFRGWLPYRKTFKNEHRDKVDLKKIASTRPGWITL